MKMRKQKVIFTLISLLSSLIAANQLNFMVLDLNNAIYYRRKRKLSSILALSKQICRARLARPRAPAKRRFWTRPGRTSAWWDNFASQNVVPEEWKENFRMSRDTFLILCEELSRQVISVIIRRVCIAITVHLGPKYIKLPSTEVEVKEAVAKFFIDFVFHSV